MFIDSAIIFCQAGQGGDGCNSFLKGKGSGHHRPDGGDGGHGGSIVLVTDPQVHTLLDLQMRKTFRGRDGKHGSSSNMTGADAEDVAIRIPIGTEIYDEKMGYLLKDMAASGQELVVCRGGPGGKGNHRNASSTAGEMGEFKTIRLELKLLADVGLVGFPNAGKSTLISRVSNAKSKIAAYPFTTKEPILGVVKMDDESFVIADIPGIIEGAHEGRGMGDRFLRHVERTKVFVHIIDMAGVDGRDPVEDYHAVNSELENYTEGFAGRPRLIVANKMDIPQAGDNLVKFKRAVQSPVHEVSAATGQGVNELIRTLFTKVQEERKATAS